VSGSICQNYNFHLELEQGSPFYRGRNCPSEHFAVTWIKTKKKPGLGRVSFIISLVLPDNLKATTSHASSTLQSTDQSEPSGKHL
jgi:hypothetical protein